jgi:predicted AlkP superfamily pyrophosphatase or phosphodiesterase
MNRGFRGLLLTLITLLVFCSPLSPQTHSRAQQPKLVVLLVVDQMRGDYVDHFHEQWTGGLARLVNQGAWFRHAAYPYLSTVTCAGHATISTGQLPKSHGIVANGWFDAVERKIVSCTADPNVTDSTYGGQAHGGDSA